MAAASKQERLVSMTRDGTTFDDLKELLPDTLRT